MAGYYKEEVVSKQKREFVGRTLLNGIKHIMGSHRALLLTALILAGEIIAITWSDKNADSLEGLDRLAASGRTASIIAMSIAADIFAVFLAGRPIKARKYNRALVSVGLTDRAGMPPQLLKEEPYHDDDYGNCEKLTFLSNGVPYSAWYDNLEALETAFEKRILYVNIGNKVSIIELIVTSPDASLPTNIVWSDDHLTASDSTYVLGKALPDRDLTYNTDDEPNLLIAATTGGGKTNLLREQIHQAIEHGVKTLLIDKKRGIDYSKNITSHVTVLMEDEEIAGALQEVIGEMTKRFDEIAKCEGANNIKEYREQGHQMQRILVVVDEMAQLTQRKTASSADKKVTDSIILNLSRIAQLGRAAGITLVLATQRPSEDVLPRQVASNINIRICGKADENLSRVAFGDGRADKQVPKNIRGRFMLEDGTMFQAYFYK